MKNFNVKLTRQELIILQDLVCQEKSKLVNNAFISDEYSVVSNLNTRFKSKLNKHYGFKINN